MFRHADLITTTFGAKIELRVQKRAKYFTPGSVATSSRLVESLASNVIVRPLSTVEYTSVASLFHCRQWSD